MIQEPTMKNLPNEVRLGNIVQYCTPNSLGEHVKFEITKENFFIFLNGGNGCEGVPLTPEILEAAGFTSGQGGGNQHWKSMHWKDIKFHSNVMPSVEMRLVIDSLGCIIWLWAKDADQPLPSLEFDVKHLHQLQNLYFALTGTELEINIGKLQKEAV